MRIRAPLLLDGAMGTELIARGLRLGVDCPEAWNVDRPADVRAIHAASFAAGAGAVTTNTFGGNRVRLATHHRSDVRALNVAGALLAREVRPTGKLVIGSVGPGGADPDVFAEQAMALAEGGVDFLHLETFYDPDEARAALAGLALGAPGLAVVASMTCRADGRTFRDVQMAHMLAAFVDGGAVAVGLNCSIGPAAMRPLIAQLRTLTDLPIFAQPQDARPAADVIALFAAGASAVGGCCGTTPADIAAINRTAAM